MSRDALHPNFDDDRDDLFGVRDYVPPPSAQPHMPVEPRFENDNAPPQQEFQRPNGTLVRTYFPQQQTTAAPTHKNASQLQTIFVLVRLLALMLVFLVLLVGVLLASGGI